MISTRVANLDDAAVVTDILTRCYPVEMARAYPQDLLSPLLDALCRANPDLLSGGTFYLATDGQRAIACGGWSAEQPGTAERRQGLAHIRHFATLPDAIGRGAGRAILKRCALDAGALGFERFEAYSSLNAEGFYLAMGFRGIEQMTLHLPDGVQAPAIRMERAI